ncbi:hypothetical protein TWF173_002237 [Orbilia oligospora]|nr:hypothetical protein TWF173_002237 [Orbilia oligospora]
MNNILNKLLSASTDPLQNNHELIKIPLFVLLIGSVVASAIIYLRALRRRRAANQDIELGEQGLGNRDRAASSTTKSTQTRAVADLNVGTGAEFTAGAGISRCEAEAGDDFEGGNEHGFADGVEACA